MGFLCGTHFRGFLYFWRKWIFIADCILYRGNIHSAECERESDRAASDDYFQPAIWDHLLFFSYYGEMMTYLGMTMPMAAFALVTWLRHPYKGNHSEVQVNTLTKKRNGHNVFPGGCNHSSILRDTELFSYCQYCFQHDFCNDKFPCCLPDFPAKPVFRSGLCCE